MHPKHQDTILMALDVWEHEPTAAEIVLKGQDAAYQMLTAGDS